MGAIEEFAKKRLDLGQDVTGAIGFVESAVSVIGSISSIVAVPTVVLGILSKLGVFNQSDAVQTQLDAIKNDFNILFSALGPRAGL